MFNRAGGRNVRTVVQSGNVLFEAPARDVAGVVQRVGKALRRTLGAESEIVLRGVGQIEALIDDAPFRGIQSGSAVKLYVTFLSRTPKVTPALPLVSSREGLEIIGLNDREVFVVSRPKGRGFFGFPKNFIEEQLGVSATTRNWLAVIKLVGLAQNQTDG